MLQYVNEFFCSTDEKKSTLVIQFNQKEPSFTVDENGQDTVLDVINNVSSVIMDCDCAQALVNIITHVLEDDIESSIENKTDE